MSRAMPYPTRWLTNPLSAPPVSWSTLDVAEASRVFSAGMASWTKAVADFSLLPTVTFKALAAQWTVLSPGAAKAVEPAKDTRLVAKTWTGDALIQDRVTRYTDDLDGSEASECVEFALDGREYEINLSDENAARLRAVLAPFAAAARPTGRRHRQPSSLTAQRAKAGSAGRSRKDSPASTSSPVGEPGDGLLQRTLAAGFAPAILTGPRVGGRGGGSDRDPASHPLTVQQVSEPRDLGGPRRLHDARTRGAVTPRMTPSGVNGSGHGSQRSQC
jgi:hypothetical protein